MREIKFRVAHYRISDNTFFGFSYWGNINHKGNFSDDCFSSPGTISGTYRKTNEQYTGLKDKIGKDIYEGDILLLHEYGEVFASVIFKNGSFCLHGFNWDVNTCEIIGNIHQNLELIK